jgi:hypothetical protein
MPEEQREQKRASNRIENMSEEQREAINTERRASRLKKKNEKGGLHVEGSSDE